ncbi:MAG: hypothetical protein HY699_17610 [Deltaproteobacteria bacterium]|nr:hypothetical protein [Deltaproteobacteria bacterium]
MAEGSKHRSASDARKAQLLGAAQNEQQRLLVGWLFDGFVALEQTEFGELEPIGVSAPLECRR